jgi:hypothetical protein
VAKRAEEKQTFRKQSGVSQLLGAAARGARRVVSTPMRMLRMSDEERDFADTAKAVREQADPFTDPKDSWVSRGAAGAAEMVPAVAATVAATAAGGPVGGMAFWFTQTVPEGYDEYRREGISDQYAVPLAVTSGALESAWEMVERNPLFPAGLRNVIGTPIRGWIKQYAKQLVKSYGKELSEEALQGATRELGKQIGRRLERVAPNEEWLAQMSEVKDRAIQETEEAVLPLAFLMAPGAAVGAAKGQAGAMLVRQAEAAEDARKFVEQNPEAARQWLESVTGKATPSRTDLPGVSSAHERRLYARAVAVALANYANKLEQARKPAKIGDFELSPEAEQQLKAEKQSAAAPSVAPEQPAAAPPPAVAEEAEYEFEPGEEVEFEFQGKALRGQVAGTSGTTATVRGPDGALHKVAFDRLQRVEEPEPVEEPDDAVQEPTATEVGAHPQRDESAGRHEESAGVGQVEQGQVAPEARPEAEAVAPKRRGRKGRVGITQATRHMLELAEKYRDAMGVSSAMTYANEREEVQEVPTYLVFAPSKIGREHARELRNLLPKHLWTKVKIGSRRHKGDEIGEDIVREYGVEQIARNIIDTAAQGETGMIRRLIAYVEEEPRAVEPHELYAIRRYNVISYDAEAAQKLASVKPEEIDPASLSVGDVVSIAAADYKVVEIDPESEVATLVGRDTIEVAPGRNLVIDKGSRRSAVPQAATPVKSQKIEANELSVGDEVSVRGEQYKVSDIDPDTEIVTLEDGVTVRVAPDEKLTIDKGSHRSGQAGEFDSAKEFFAPGRTPGGKAGKQPPPRIPVAPLPPLPGEKGRPTAEIYRAAYESISRRYHPGSDVGRPGAAGVFRPAEQTVLTKGRQDVVTPGHELAHELDDNFNILGAWAKKKTRSPYDAELKQFWVHGSPGKLLATKRAEGLAVWVEDWMKNPDATEAVSPSFTAYFKSKVPADVLAELRKAGDELRRWTGLMDVAPERAVAGSIESLEPEPRDLRKTAVDWLTKNGLGTRLDVWDTVGFRLWDSMKPLITASHWGQTLNGIADPLPKDDATFLVDRWRHHSSIINDALENGMITPDHNRVAGLEGGLKALEQDLDTSSPQSWHDDLRAASAYMFGQRVLELAQRWRKDAADLVDANKKAKALVELLKKTTDPQDKKDLLDDLRAARAREKRARQRLGFSGKVSKVDAFLEEKLANRITGWGRTIFSDVDVAARIIASLSKDPVRLARIEKFAARMRLWWDALLDYGKANSLWSAEQVDAVRRDNEFYVSFARLLEKRIGPLAGGRKALGLTARTMCRIMGSDAPLQNPFISLVEQTAAVMRESLRNSPKLAFFDMLIGTRAMYGGKPIDLDAIAHRITDEEAKTHPRKISLWRDGKMEHWAVQAPLLYKSIMEMHPGDAHWLLRNFIFPFTRFYRYMIVHSLEFVVRNVLRDAFARSVISRHGSNPLDLLKGYTEEELSEYRRMGGITYADTLSTRESYERVLRRNVEAVVGRPGTVLGSMFKLKHALDRISDMSEEVGRIGEFRRAKEHARTKLGYDEYNARIYAATAANGLIDFAVAGTLVRDLNSIILFLNAGVQGLRAAGISAKADPAGFAARLMMFTMPMSMAEYSWAVGQDREKELWQLPIERRDFFWNFCLGDWGYLSIPKPFEMGLLSAVASRMIAHVRGDAHAFDGVWGSLWQGFVPVDEGSLYGAFKGIVEVLNNRVFYGDRYIVHPVEAKLEVSERKGTERASAVAKILAKAFGTVGPDVDPRNIDHLVSTYLAGYGRAAVRAAKGEPVDAVRGLSGVLTRVPAGEARDVRAVTIELGEKNLLQAPEFRELEESRRAYYDASKDRPARARELQETGTRLRARVEGGAGRDVLIGRALNVLAESPPKAGTAEFRDYEERVARARRKLDDLGVQPPEYRKLFEQFERGRGHSTRLYQKGRHEPSAYKRKLDRLRAETRE